MLIRKGQCNRCGQCCQFTGCRHFEFIDGVATCKIYDNRPQCCKDFPPFPEVFKHKTFRKEIKNCGYYFEEEKI